MEKLQETSNQLIESIDFENNLKKIDDNGVK